MTEANFLGVPSSELAKAGLFGLLSAAWDLELILPESAPGIMQEAMCHGHVDERVVHVAGLVSPTRADNAPELASAFHALPGAPVTREEALGLLSKYWLERVVLGTDAEVEAILRAADSAYSWLDYPGEPFSTLAYFRDMCDWDDDDKPPLTDVVQRARKWAENFLSGKD